MDADEKRVDLYLQLYLSNVERIAHYQEQRSTVGNLFLLVIGGLIALVTFDQRLSRLDLIPTVVLTGLGLFGMIWSVKYHERVAFYWRRAEAFKDALDEGPERFRIAEIEESADRLTRAEWRAINTLRVWYLWFVFYQLISWLGVVMVGLVLGWPSWLVWLSLVVVSTAGSGVLLIRKKPSTSPP